MPISILFTPSMMAFLGRDAEEPPEATEEAEVAPKRQRRFKHVSVPDPEHVPTEHSDSSSD